MTGLCTGLDARLRNGEHRWEYFEVRQGEEYERCFECGETRFVRFYDLGSGW